MARPDSKRADPSAAQMSIFLLSPPTTTVLSSPSRTRPSLTTRLALVTRAAAGVTAAPILHYLASAIDMKDAEDAYGEGAGESHFTKLSTAYKKEARGASQSRFGHAPADPRADRQASAAHADRRTRERRRRCGHILPHVGNVLNFRVQARGTSQFCRAAADPRADRQAAAARADCRP